MNHPSARLTALLVTVGLLGAGQVRADFTNWSYQWSMQPSSVIASGTGSVTYAVNPGGNAASNINVASVSSTSTATSTNADSYSSPYTLTMKINQGDGSSGTLTWNGTLSGSVNAGSSSLFNHLAQATESTTLGTGANTHHYSVTLQLQPTDGSVGAPGTAASTISAVVKVDGSSPGTGPGTGPGNGGSGGPTTGPTTNPQQVPEPSALVLATMACSACGVGGWLRRVRQRIGVA